jgi:hypothetical protein
MRREWTAIMNTDVEDLLRHGMERATADLRAPAGLLCQAARRRRRRRLVFRSGAGAVAVLAAAAVALVAAGVPVASDDVTMQPGFAPAAYVVTRVNSALNTAEPDDIAQMMVTTSGSAAGPLGTMITEEWSYGDQWRSAVHTTGGQLIVDQGVSSSSVFTLVNHPGRVFARQRGGPLGYGPGGQSWPAPGTCWPGTPGGPLLFGPGLLLGMGLSATPPTATVVKGVRAAIACGTLTVAGHERVNGVEAIKLTSTRNSFIAETIWVGPGTYLPVRIVVRQRGVQQEADITWLTPTPQNLATLTVPIPAGFREVPLSEAGIISVRKP